LTDYISSGAYSADVHRNLRFGHIYRDRVSFGDVILPLRQTISAGQELDRCKKALFYGKDLPEYQLRYLTPGFAMHLEDANVPVDLFHGILGLITETAEIGEALSNALPTINEPKRLDTVNLREEIGDCLWYLSVMAKALGTSLEECAQINTAKLRKRFPDNFTEDAAINRDLDGERAVLEVRSVATGEVIGHRLDFAESRSEGMEPDGGLHRGDPRDEVFTSGSDLDA